MYSTKSTLLAIVLLGIAVVGFVCGEKSDQPFGPRALTFEERLTEANEERLTEAKGGDAEAQYQVARMYHYGSGAIFADKDEAVMWYRKSAEQGHMLAQYNLARTYHSLPTGDSDFSAADSQDRDEAAKWYGKAAEQGHTPSQHELAACYEYGWGVPRDLVPAYVWTLISLEGRQRFALCNLLKLNPEMTPEQHEAAESLFYRISIRVRRSRFTPEKLAKQRKEIIKAIDGLPNRGLRVSLLKSLKAKDTLSDRPKR